MVGTIISSYQITEYLGQGEFESFWAGQHIDYGFPVRMRILKSEFAGNADLRIRYLNAQRAEAAAQGRVEGLSYQVFEQADFVCVVLPTEAATPLDSKAWEERLAASTEGIYSKSGTSAPPPSEGVMSEFHAQIQLFAKLGFVVDLLMAIGLGIITVLMGMRKIDEYILLAAAPCVAFVIATIGAVGLLERKLWARQGIIVSHFALFALAGLNLMFAYGTAEHGFARLHISTPTAMIMVLACMTCIGYSIWGLVLMYSKKAAHYFV